MLSRLSQSAFIRLQQRGELELLCVQHPLFSADLLLQGAQLLRFAPAGDSNWLWLSEQAAYLQGQSVRGGIPVCWPWFGNAAMNPPAVQAHLTDSNAAPAHGFARARRWALSHWYEAADRVELTLMLEDNRHPLWQANLQPQLRLIFSAYALQLELTTRNQGSETATFSQALHTYFPTADINATRVQGLHDCRYIDTLEQWQEKTQTGAVAFHGETDRIYYPSQPIQLHSPQRRLTLQTEGSRSAVVWNPWINKSLTLSQFAADAWQRMFCVETANAAADAVTLAPGAEHRLVLRLSQD
ncbi:D-hexose-6-phosphate mutarotase [Venatoribacter cucullus]|uniref:D-hexose-6-phosphate mutarotase n=1 Tax=Venatoribacter cucullus TaxID=2661630 RepID=UPI001E558B8C|nr:D-hexose-6-phosphate mutarotase [Venatoribacter cucullus]